MANPEHAHFRQAADESHNLRLLAVGICALVVFAAGVLWSWLILESRGGSTRPESRIPTPGAPAPTVGMLFQFPFDPDVARPPAYEAQSARLDSWGWSDRARGRVHMPVRRAIERYLESQPKGRDDD